MDNVSTTRETQWPNMGHENSTTNPSITEIIKDESNEVITVVIFVISAVLVIISIFVLAIFIDCRQQKIQNSQINRMRKRAKRKIQKVFPTLPTIGETSHIEDQKIIVNSMHTEHQDIP